MGWVRLGWVEGELCRAYIGVIGSLPAHLPLGKECQEASSDYSVPVRGFINCLTSYQLFTSTPSSRKEMSGGIVGL